MSEPSHRELQADHASAPERLAEKSTSARGRPRSEVAMTAVLSAAYEHAARDRGRSATIESIAKASGVSKVTIYKWWEDRQTLLTDAFLWYIGLEVPLSESVDPVQAIHQHAARYVSQLNGEMGRVLKVVLAECLTKSGNMSTFCERYLNERRDLGARVIAAGQRSGIINSQRRSTVPLRPNLRNDLLSFQIWFSRADS